MQEDIRMNINHIKKLIFKIKLLDNKKKLYLIFLHVKLIIKICIQNTVF